MSRMGVMWSLLVALVASLSLLLAGGCGGGGEGDGAGGDSADGGAVVPDAEPEPEPDPTTVEGSAKLFAAAMAAGDYVGAAEVTDPSSPARETLAGIGEQLVMIEQQISGSVELPDEQKLAGQLVLQAMRSVYADPFTEVNVEVVELDEEGDLALAELTFPGMGEDGADLVQPAQFNRFDGVWLLFLTEDLLRPSPAGIAAANELMEQSGIGDEAGDDDEGGMDGDG